MSEGYEVKLTIEALLACPLLQYVWKKQFEKVSEREHWLAITRQLNANKVMGLIIGGRP